MKTQSLQFLCRKTLFKHTLSKDTWLTALITAGVLAALPLMSTAETVQIPIGQQGQDKQGIQRPRTGMGQTQVREQFGNPLDWTNPVGEPPISKWTYANFIVYFEYDHVIHSVLVHTPQPSTGSETEVGTEVQSTSSGSDALSVLRQGE
jgi:hypothetical protein